MSIEISYNPLPGDVFKLWYDEFGLSSERYGDPVIVILDDDTVVIGPIEEFNQSWIKIGGKQGGQWGYAAHVEWEQIRFMAYEGFPVRKLLCAPQPKTMGKIRSLSRAAQIRKALRQEFDGTFQGTSIVYSLGCLIDDCLRTADRYKAKARDFIVRKRPTPRGLTFGDPFCAEFVAGALLNPGNHGPWWDDEPDEETVLLEAADGSRALLWDLPSVLAVEA